MERVKFSEISNYTTEARGIKDMIILHWSGGNYDTVHSDYHVNIDGSGDIWMDGSLADRRQHTYMRNTPTIGISISCMYNADITPEGFVVRGRYPYKEIQLDTMAKVLAKICVEVGIPLSQVYTHSEIADIDGYGFHSKDPEMKWDLIHQGDDLRRRAKEYMELWGCW